MVGVGVVMVGVGYVPFLSLVRVAVPRVMHGGLVNVPGAAMGVGVVRYGTVMPRSLIALRNPIVAAGVVTVVRGAVTIARVSLTLLKVVIRG